MTHPCSITAALCLAFLLSAVPAKALEVGVASCDITPDVKGHTVPMAGYGARKGQPSTGVHDPLHAKILLLRDGRQSMALVTCDLRSVTPQLKHQTLRKISDLGLTPDTLFLCGSHTHDGPSIFPEKFWELQFGKCDPAVVDAMSGAIAGGLHAAAKNLAPARVGFGSERLEGFTHNRRWGYDNEARKAAGETPAINPILSVLRVDGNDGKCRALLVHFATHPTILGASNMLMSAEWPGVLQQSLESAFPGAVALYCNGAEGDQSPAGAQGADEFARVKDFGTRLAQRAQTVAQRVKTKPNQPIGIVRITPDLPPIEFSPGARNGAYKSYEPLALEALPKQAEIQVLRIGDTALAGLPGEPICEVGMATQKQVAAAGFKNVLAIGLANDYLGYIVNEKEYPHAGYEVDTRSYYGPGLGSLLASKAGEAAAKLSR
ncbi:MAG: neutral/alkaline non-lysosomal ceramidase N-terminal domain-containing protein [Verrucomicrobia bacterium]|nr:neutral/alkaline non-lysosomal ceramidase N-terminal domain-containing protein [Verrucomicrobiota bacterium]